MNRHILFIATVASMIIATLAAAQDMPTLPENTGPEPMYSVQKHTFQVRGTTSYAHPQQITPEQMTHILSAIMYEMDFGMRVPVLNAEERIQLGEKAADLFGSVSPQEQVMIQKTILPKQDQGESDPGVLQLYLCFLDPNTLYVSVVHRNMEIKGSIATGHNMMRYTNPEGRSSDNIVCIDRKLWTEDIKKPVFDVDLNRLQSALKRKEQLDQQDSGVTGTDQKPAKASLTVEELEKELSKLHDLLEKKLITKEEYSKLRAELMKRAGIGGTGNGS